MVGRTLSAIRARLDSLSVAVGPYRVSTATTGDGPVPVTGLQFPDWATAAEATTLASAYRRALRRYDPRVTVHDLVVTETGLGTERCDETPATLPEYCHTVAGALFETLSERHGPVERTVMDAYLDAAARTADRERLCLTLLERSADALAARLTDEEQATVLLATAGRLPARSAAGDPLSASLGTLRTRDLLEDYAVEPVPTDAGRRARRVSLVGYRPSLSDQRCPVLPVVVELLRRTPVAPRLGAVARTETGWEFVVATAGDCPPAGLSVAAAGR